MKQHSFFPRVFGFILVMVCVLPWSSGNLFAQKALAQADDPSPPGQTVKLVFIHHSCGENWLADGYGDLGIALGENNYFVSDTNYGWGPEAIGDRTDILNWPEWFRGPETPRFMQALFSESGQNSSYTRNRPDPGGENQIVMFKSCFPNSEMQGSPGDPPAPGDELSVGNAKYIYNDLLEYFQSRPDKMFVAVTAPPLQDPTFADNARAFNTWLVQDWLRENNYTAGNVAVFDFYNILTHPDNHHRFANGAVEYITNSGGNTLFYPSGDDHPNPEGSRKATGELVPLLNVYYHRWVAGAPVQPPPQQPPEQQPTQPTGDLPVEIPPAPLQSSLVDDFEAGPPPESEGWTPYWEEGTQTALACAPEGGMVNNGSLALHINYAIQANSWGTCAMFYSQTRDWRSSGGLSMYVHAAQPAQVFDVNVYEGLSDNRAGYIFSVETTQQMVDGWVHLEFPWEMLRRAEWEADPGSPLVPDQVAGMAIGFNTFPDAPNNGELWVDDILLMGPAIQASVATQPVAEATSPGQPEPTADSQEEEAEEGGGGICPLSPALGMLAGGAALLAHRRRRM